MDPNRRAAIERDLERLRLGQIASLPVTDALHAFYAEARNEALAEIDSRADLSPIEKANQRLLRTDSHERPPELFRLCSQLEQNDVRVLLRDWWRICDHIRPFRREALLMFVLATAGGRGPILDASASIPTVDTVVYRGACVAEVFDRNGRRKRSELLGISWTSDPVIAEKFLHDRFHQAVQHKFGAKLGRPVILSAKVHPATILGAFFGRGESEIVVDPRSLSEIRVRFPG